MDIPVRLESRCSQTDKNVHPTSYEYSDSLPMVSGIVGWTFLSVLNVECSQTDKNVHPTSYEYSEGASRIKTFSMERFFR
jgi:hypothetical protein